MKNRSHRIALLVVCFLLAGSALLACPTCADSISQQEGVDLATGYFWSILFMIAAPFAVFGTVLGYFALLLHREADLEGTTDPEDAPPLTD